MSEAEIAERLIARTEHLRRAVKADEVLLKALDEIQKILDEARENHRMAL